MNIELNKEKYDELCNRAGNEPLSLWYQNTYEVFKSQKVETKDDFIKVIAFAYSWMPTIPDIKKELDWDICKCALGKLKCKEQDALKNVLEIIVPSINNSIVGASKVLHFMFPEEVTVIDSNVVTGWRAIFYPTGTRGKSKSTIAALPKDFGLYGKDKKKLSRHIGLYNKYNDNIVAWSEVLNDVSMRDIEAKLYLLGKNIKEKEKKKGEKEKK